MSNIRKLALVVLAAAVLGGAALLYLSSRTDTGYVLAKPVERYAQITDADLKAVALPLSRAQEFQVVTDKTSIVGKYAAQTFESGTLIAPWMVLAEPPELRVFSSGKALPAGMRGYPLSISTELAPIVSDEDLLDLLVVDPEAGTATWIISNVEPIYILTPKGSATSVYLLALDEKQISSLEGALADARVSETGAYPKLVLSQSQNSPIAPGTVIKYREGAPAGLK